MRFSCCIPSRSTAFPPHEHEVVQKAASPVSAPPAKPEQPASESSPSPLLDLPGLAKNNVVQQLMGTGGKHAAAALHEVCREMRALTMANLPCITVESTEELERGVKKYLNLQEVVFKASPDQRYSFAALNRKRLQKLTIEPASKGQSSLPSIDTAAFADLGLVQSLILKEVNVIDTGKAVLPKQPALQHLQLEKCGNLPEPLLALLIKAPLRSLHLVDMEVKDGDLLQVCELPKLENLSIDFCPRLTTEGIAAALEKLPNLLTLELKDLWRSVFGGISLRAIAASENLIGLKLDGYRQLTANDISNLPTSLRSLRFHFRENFGVEIKDVITTEALERLARLENLTCLEIDGCKPFTDAELNLIGNLGQLNELSLNFFQRRPEPLTSDSLNVFKGKPFKRLELTSARFEADAFSEANWPHLSTLNLKKARGLSEANFRDLVDQASSLTNLSLDFIKTIPPGFHHVAKLRKLKILDLGRIENLCNSDLAPLAHLPIKQFRYSPSKHLTKLPSAWINTLQSVNDKPPSKDPLARLLKAPTIQPA